MSNLPDPTVNELEEAMMVAIIGDNPIEYSQNGLQKRERLIAAIQAHIAREVAEERRKQIEDLWAVHGIFFPTSNVCSFCVGVRNALEHDQLMSMIELRVGLLVQLTSPNSQEDQPHDHL